MTQASLLRRRPEPEMGPVVEDLDLVVVEEDLVGVAVSAIKCNMVTVEGRFVVLTLDFET
jgi:hypothetical protein